MIAEKLQKSILQAAIQGKLTEQLPEDGNARDLLEEIKAEKTRLVKEGKIKKETQPPEITEDEIPFDIPEKKVSPGKALFTGVTAASDRIKNPINAKSIITDSFNIVNIFRTTEPVFIPEILIKKTKITNAEARTFLPGGELKKLEFNIAER